MVPLNKEKILKQIKKFDKKHTICFDSRELNFLCKQLESNNPFRFIL